MKSIKIVFVIIVAILHVHLSTMTANNGMNPLTIIELGFSAGSHILKGGTPYYLYGIIIQSFITALLVDRILRWKERWIGYISVVISLIIGLNNTTCFNTVCEDFPSLSNSYEYVYGYSNALNAVVYFSTIQLLFFCLFALIVFIKDKLIIPTLIKNSNNRFSTTRKLAQLKSMVNRNQRKLDITIFVIIILSIFSL